MIEEFLARRLDHVRGFLVGLVIGDAVTAPSHLPWGSTTCTSQLALFATEGLIRHEVRARLKGISSARGVVWHALNRWAAGQGIEGDFRGRWVTEGAWPDGWLVGVAPLRERRGNAPATVRALRGLEKVPASGVNDSAGYHGLTTALVAGVFERNTSAARLVAEIASLTHGHPDAASAAGVGAVLVDELLMTAELVAPLRGPYEAVVGDLSGSPLVDVPGTAPHAFVHACRANMAADSLQAAIDAARPFGPGAVTVAAAFFGAAHGLSGIPEELFTRVDVAWVADTLARDGVMLLSGGVDLESPRRDPMWWTRYPGW